MKKENLSFVKWAGGKRQLLKQFKPLFPEKVNTYIEPFVGGGAVLFYIIKNHKPRKIIISDINEELINTYEVIKSDVDSLIKELKKLKKRHNKRTYKKIRSEDPNLLSPLTRASRFIYLNKTCFNGLYRVNSKNEFNVPMGRYKNPSIVMEESLRDVSKLLKKVQIKEKNFEECVKWAKKGNFIYLDPPYHPLKGSKSFTTYTKGNFLENEQKKLKEVFDKLDKKGCKVMLSNSNTKFIKELYKDYNIKFVKATRMINSDSTKRGKIKEVVITNY